MTINLFTIMIIFISLGYRRIDIMFRHAHYLMHTLFLILTLILSCIACGPSYVRGGDDPDFEKAALSTKLDSTDLEKLFKKTSKDLFKSAISKKWKKAQKNGKEATVAILPLVNETTEHIDNSLQTLLKQLETKLINRGEVTVISKVDQPQLLHELRAQRGASFNQQKVAKMGRQLGAHYFLTGRIYSVTEKSEDRRRVQYFLFMQVLEVETGAIRWQKESKAVKGIID